MFEINARFIRGSNRKARSEFGSLTELVGDLDDDFDDLLAQLRVTCLQKFVLFIGGHVGHLKRSESIQLGGIDSEGSGKFTTAIDGGDELHIIRDWHELVVDGVKEFSRRVQGRHQGVPSRFLTAIEFIEEEQILPMGILLGFFEFDEKIGFDEIRDR